MIYFIRVPGFIKIGYSSRPKTRIESHQTSSPYPIEIIGVFPGGLEMEAALHRHFAAYNVRGEWFAGIDDLLEGVFSHLRVGTFSTETEPTEVFRISRGTSTMRRRRTWIEFREKNGRRYARYRSWSLIDGEWSKKFHGRVNDLPAMSEVEYRHYTAQRQLAKIIRGKGVGNQEPGIAVVPIPSPTEAAA